jgi:hypothetical protein
MLTRTPDFQVASGDPARLAQAAVWHLELADALELHGASIRGTAGQLIGSWNGEAASSYQRLSELMWAQFETSSGEARTAAAGLRRYAVELERCQHEGTIALHQAEHWLGEQDLWTTRLEAAQSAVQRAQAQLSGLAAQSATLHPTVALAMDRADQSALACAQAQEAHARQELKHAMQQVILWEGRGRLAWLDALQAAHQAGAIADGVQIDPPPLAGWAVPGDPALGVRGQRSGTSTSRAGGLGPFDSGVWGPIVGHWAATAGRWMLGHIGEEISKTSYGQAMQEVADATDSTIGMCAGGGVDAPGFGASGSICYTATPQGSGFTVTTGAAGDATAGFGASGFVGPEWSTGRRLSDQGGYFSYVSGSAGEGPYAAGGALFWGTNSQGKMITTGSIGWTPSVQGSPASAQLGRSYTWTFPDKS